MTGTISQEVPPPAPPPPARYTVTLNLSHDELRILQCATGMGVMNRSGAFEMMQRGYKWPTQTTKHDVTTFNHSLWSVVNQMGRD